MEHCKTVGTSYDLYCTAVPSYSNSVLQVHNSGIYWKDIETYGRGTHKYECLQFIMLLLLI